MIYSYHCGNALWDKLIEQKLYVIGWAVGMKKLFEIGWNLSTCELLSGYIS